MEFPAWATPGEKRKLFGYAKANGADELTLSDFDATTGYMAAREGKTSVRNSRIHSSMTFYLVLLTQ